MNEGGVLVVVQEKLNVNGGVLHLLTLQDRRCCTSDLNPPWQIKSVSESGAQ
jgi:hypothetical protein